MYDSNIQVDPFGLDETIVPTDLTAFGNATSPRPPRPSDVASVMEGGIIKSQSGVEWPVGASTFDSPSKAPLTGHYHTIPKGTKLPEGLAVKADGADVGGPMKPGHHTIYNIEDMTLEEFQNKFSEIDSEYGGKKICK